MTAIDESTLAEISFEIALDLPPTIAHTLKENSLLSRNFYEILEQYAEHYTSNSDFNNDEFNHNLEQLCSDSVARSHSHEQKVKELTEQLKTIIVTKFENHLAFTPQVATGNDSSSTQATKSSRIISEDTIAHTLADNLIYSMRLGNIGDTEIRPSLIEFIQALQKQTSDNIPASDLKLRAAHDDLNAIIMVSYGSLDNERCMQEIEAKIRSALHSEISNDWRRKIGKPAESIPMPGAVRNALSQEVASEFNAPDALQPAIAALIDAHVTSDSKGNMLALDSNLQEVQSNEVTKAYNDLIDAIKSSYTARHKGPDTVSRDAATTLAQSIDMFINRQLIRYDADTIIQGGKGR